MRTAPTLTAICPHWSTNFGGNHKLVAVVTGFDPAPNHFFADTTRIVFCPERINVGSVNKIATMSNICIHNRLAGGFIRRPTKLHRAKRQRGNHQTRSSKCTVIAHAQILQRIRTVNCQLGG